MKKTLTHWGRVTHICVGNLTSIDSDNGLSPERRQAITWTNAGLNELSELCIQNTNVFFPENACGNDLCEMAAIVC